MVIKRDKKLASTDAISDFDGYGDSDSTKPTVLEFLLLCQGDLETLGASSIFFGQLAVKYTFALNASVGIVDVVEYSENSMISVEGTIFICQHTRNSL